MRKDITKKLMIIIGIMLLIVIAKSPISKATTTYQAGENITAVLDDQGTLTISGTGAMTDYTNLEGIPWYSVKGSIKSVIVEKGITKIGTNAFYECINLESVVLNEGLTTVGMRAFAGVTSLTEIKIPKSVTEIKASAFFSNANLKKVEILNSNSAIGALNFSGCPKVVVCAEKGSTAEQYINEKATDYGSGAKSMNILTYSTIDWTNGTVEIEFNGGKIKTFSTNGTYACEYQVVYSDINRETESILIAVNWIDKYAPDISSFSSDISEWTNKTVNLKVIANDELSGLAEQAYSWDGKKTWTAEKIHTISENGTYIVYVKDKVGNISSKEITISNICKVGDINEDEKIDVTDLLLLKRHIVSGSKNDWRLTDKKLVISDINKDGKVDVTDLLLIKRHIVSEDNE